MVAAVANLPEKQSKNVRRKRADIRIEAADGRGLQNIPDTIAAPAWLAFRSR
jgi:hypothetical protein